MRKIGQVLLGVVLAPLWIPHVLLALFGRKKKLVDAPWIDLR
ncbi:MAG: hypothetical protein ACM33U_09040 [Solirubrobacterales bacterium]|nr:hypothetical protein [Solirubrobacterales bacterium]